MAFCVVAGDVLELFASVAVAVDKPFEVVGIKTTSIHSLDGEQSVMANAELLKQTGSTDTRLGKRRAVFSFDMLATASAAAP